MEEMSSAYYYPTHPHPAPHSSSHYPTPPPPAYNYYLPPPPIPGVGAPSSHNHHNQHPPLAAPAPQYSLPPQPQPPPPPSRHHQIPLDDQLRTLFIGGLPDDVKAREIYNLFRDFPGFESSKLRSVGSTRAYAFAVFTDQQSAVNAIQSLNGLRFDLEKESTLYIDLAKANSRGKRTRTDNGLPHSPDKIIRGSVAYSTGFLDSGVGSNIHMPGMGNSAYSIDGYPSTQSQASYDYQTTDPNKSLSISSKNSIPQSNKPCSTLFVANLGPTCLERELTDVFGRFPGFVKLKMQKKNGLPVAFVDFEDVASSTGALNYLQGRYLHSSVGEGMRLAYAKSRMGQLGREKKA